MRARLAADLAAWEEISVSRCESVPEEERKESGRFSFFRSFGSQKKKRRKEKKKEARQVHVVESECANARRAVRRVRREFHKGFPPLFSPPWRRVTVARLERASLPHCIIMYRIWSHLVKLCGRSSLPLFPFPPAAPSCRGWRPEWGRSRGPGSFIRLNGALEVTKGPEKPPPGHVRRGAEVCGFRSVSSFPIVAPATFYLHWLAGSVGRTLAVVYGVWCFTERSINKGEECFMGFWG